MPNGRQMAMALLLVSSAIAPALAGTPVAVLAFGPRCDNARICVPAADFDRDDRAAMAEWIDKPCTPYRRVQLISGRYQLMVAINDDALPRPYGLETTGYEVGDLVANLGRPVAAGATVIVPAAAADDRRAGIVESRVGRIARHNAQLSK